MQKEDITFFAGVPTMYWGLLGALDDDVDVERIAGNLRIGGRPAVPSLPVEIIKEVKERFGVQILEGYGLSETSPVATFNRPGPAAEAGLDRRRRSGASRLKLIDRRLEDDRGRRRDRRDRDPRPQHHEGLLQPARRRRRG